MEPAGRRALVTGGGRGIGAAVAQALTAAGAVVTVLGRALEPLRETVAAGSAAGYVQADVTDAAGVRRAVDEAERARGPLSILINNAGAAESGPFARLERDVWDRMIAVNLTSVYDVTRAVLPAMARRGWGRVVSIASTAGLTGYPYVAAYVAAKHGVVGLTRSLALEQATSGVTVNAVCPGYTETDLLLDSMAEIERKTGKSQAEVRARFARSNPQGRLVRPAEVAAAVLFLCGPGSDAINGLALPVAGGEVM